MVALMELSTTYDRDKGSLIMTDASTQATEDEGSYVNPLISQIGETFCSRCKTVLHDKGRHEYYCKSCHLVEIIIYSSFPVI